MKAITKWLDNRYYELSNKKALPRFMRMCCCRSYHRRTGKHAQACPRYKEKAVKR